MNEEMVLSVISYLGPMHTYVKLMRTYYERKDMDDFDKGYVDFFSDFEKLIQQHLQDPKSPLMTLIKHYQEIIVDYEDSILYRCLEALENGYDKHQFFMEGKKAVYLQYLAQKYHLDGKRYLDEMSAEDFETFEKTIFTNFNVEALKKAI